MDNSALAPLGNGSAPTASVKTGGSPYEPDLRLALFTDTYLPQLNGVTRTLHRLARAVRARGGAVRVYAPDDPSTVRDAPDEQFVWRRPSIPFWAYPQLRLVAPVQGRIRGDLEAWRPTLIHSATQFGLGITGWRCARAMGVPFVTSYHTHFSEYATFYHMGGLRKIGEPLMRSFHNVGARTYVPTRAVLTQLEQQGFERLAIWGRGIDGERFNPAFRSSAWRARFGADDETVVVAYVGRIAAEKGLDTALGAMHKLADRASSAARGRRIVFALAGDGPYEAYCRRSAPPPPAVHFVGPLEGRALSEFFASADIFIFPSTTDTFGNVLLEAMSSGLPIVASDVPPTRELLEGGGGITVPRGDPAAFAAAIEELASDPARRAAIGARGLAYAATCSWDQIFDELVADYRRVIAAGPPPGADPKA